MRETTADDADDRQMLVSFDVAGQEYAFALDVVLEVLDAPESLAALPASEDLVLGVAPFRDTLLPLLSCAACWASRRGMSPMAGRKSSSPGWAAPSSGCWPTACARSSPPTPT